MADRQVKGSLLLVSKTKPVYNHIEKHFEITFEIKWYKICITKILIFFQINKFLTL